MKVHTSNYKDEVKKLGKQLDSKITYTLNSEEIELGNPELNSVTPHYEANILKSVMKELDIDSNVEIPIGTELNYQFGILVNGSYEYLDFGNYVVKEVEKQEDTNSWEIKCYDKMLYSMVDYEQMNIEYPITIRNYLSAICNKLGLTFSNASDNFVNYNMEIPAELYLDEDGNSLGYTFRDVLDDLAEVTASTIIINNDDELEIRYINDTEDTIDEEYLKNVNVKFGEKYGAVNTVVLSRSAGADKISQSIPSNLPDEDKIPVIIENNLIMNDNDRAEFIPGILNELYGLEYYLNDFSSTGITYYDVCDKYNVQIGDTTYSCIMFNDEINVTQGLEELVHTDMPEYGEVDYKKTDKTDQKINQTNLIVDKQGRQITQIISEQGDNTQRLNETISTLDSTIQRVSRTETSINDITTTTQVSTGKNSLYLEDAMETNALSYSVDGATEQEGTPTPDNLVEVKTIPSIMNLFDKENTEWVRNNNSNYQSTSNTNTTRIRTQNLIQLEGGKTYTLSGTPSGITINSIKFYANIGDTSVTSSVTTATFTVPTNATYVIFQFGGSNFTDETNTLMANTNFMLEEGSVSHEYVSYGYYTRVKVTGKNMLTIKDITNVGSLVNNGDGSITINGGFSSTSWTLSNPITLKADISYTLSLTNTYENAGSSAFILRHGSTNVISLLLTDNSISYTPTQDVVIDTIRMYNAGVTYSNYTFSVQLEQNNQATTYEPYKENQVLIDMSKENLFDSSSATVLQCGITNTKVEYAVKNRTTYIACKPNTTYTIVKRNDGNTNRFRAGTTTTLPEADVSISQYIASDNSPSITITTNSTAQYLAFQFYRTDETLLTEQQVLNSIRVYESNNPTPYYELCKLGDYKDTLSIDSSGNCVINKNVDKVILNGTEKGWEQWTSQTFTNTILCGTTILDNIPRIGYVQMSNYFTGQSSTMWATDVEGVTVAGTGTTTLRFRINKTTASDINAFKTWLSTHNTDVYYALATPETINLPNTKIPLFDGINHVTFVDDLETNTSIHYYRNTPLSGTYATMTQLNDVSTEKTQEIIQVRNEVQTEISSTQASINVINETIENGVSKVNGTGYTFDSEGLKIEKTNQDVKSLLDNDGLAVSYKGTDILTVRSNGIEAENMTVRKFYVQRPIRMEKTKSISDGTSVGLGFFYVGEE